MYNTPQIQLVTYGDGLQNTSESIVPAGQETSTFNVVYWTLF